MHPPGPAFQILNSHINSDQKQITVKGAVISWKTEVRSLVGKVWKPFLPWNSTLRAGCGLPGIQVPFIWGYFWSVRSVGQSEEAGTAPSEGGESLGQDALRHTASPQDPRTRTTVFWLPWVQG